MSRDGTLIKKSANSASWPPDSPVIATTVTPNSLAVFAARSTLIELPEVLIAKSVSPGRADPSRALAKTVS